MIILLFVFTIYFSVFIISTDEAAAFDRHFDPLSPPSKFSLGDLKASILERIVFYTHSIDQSFQMEEMFELPRDQEFFENNKKIREQYFQEKNKLERLYEELDKLFEQPTPPKKLPTTEDSGDPIMFSLYDSEIIILRTWPEQHDVFQWYFPLNNMATVQVDRKIESGYMLFKDLDGNHYPTNGMEIGNTPFHDNITAYEAFLTPENDSNNNGMIDKYDVLWPMFKVWDTSTDQILFPENLGIIGFQLDVYVDIEDDYVGPGRYLDCEYVEDWAYDDYVEIHGENWCIPWGEHHIRVQAIAPDGVIMDTGERFPSYAVPLGYRGETSSEIPN